MKRRDAPSLIELETIPCEPRNDVKMDVWDKLRRHRAVGEEQAESLATES